MKQFIEKRLQHRCFPMKFPQFLRTTILKNICERLLLKIALNLYEETAIGVFYFFLSTFWKNYLSYLAECQKLSISSVPNNHCPEKFHKIPETLVTVFFYVKLQGVGYFADSSKQLILNHLEKFSLENKYEKPMMYF